MTELRMLIVMRGVGSNPTGKFTLRQKMLFFIFFELFEKNYVKFGFNL